MSGNVKLCLLLEMKDGLTLSNIYSISQHFNTLRECNTNFNVSLRHILKIH